MPIRFPTIISNNRPLIIGHRGASARAPENTLAAFALAMDDGADGVELDVRLAKDGVPVVIHDPTLRRTGRCSGIVAELTSKELGQKDVGSWFNRAHPQLACQEYSGQVVPTLDQVLQIFSNDRSSRAAPGAVLYLELKMAGIQDSQSDLARAVVQLVNDRGLRNRAVLVSFNLATLTRIKQLDPAIRTGALFAPNSHPGRIVRKQAMVTAAVDSGADELLLHRMIARPGAMRAAAKYSLSVVIWTVADPRWLGRARSRGIHALITNDPALLSKRAFRQEPESKTRSESFFRV